MADDSAKTLGGQILGEGDETYRALFEESRDAMLIGSLDGQIVAANRAAVELFGFSRKEELLEKNIGRDLYWTPEERRKAETLFREQGFLEKHQADLRRADGERIRVEETASVIRGEKGEPIGFRGIVRDVSERLYLERQLHEAQRTGAVGRLARGVAHDFNNLLTAINGYSELILARMPAADTQRMAVEEIRKAGRRAAEITRRLLTLARHQDFSPRRLDLNRLVGEMDRLLRRVLGEDVVFKTFLDPGLQPIFADASQMEQVLLNLALNARDAMPEGGELVIETHQIPAGERLAEALAPGRYARLTVRDNGEGMTPEVLERAVTPLFTTRSGQQYAGLGLSVVHDILRQTGGHLEIASDFGAGTELTLYLPHFAERAKPAPARPAAAPGDELVLLVEDEAAVRELVRQILEMYGYRVLMAIDADAAKRHLEAIGELPALLLTDIVMPGDSGVTLAKELRRECRGLRILFMSGYTDHHAEIRQLVTEGANFIAKPFSPEELARKVRQVLEAPPPAVPRSL